MAVTRTCGFKSCEKVPVVLLHKTSGMVFYRQQRSWWYHLSNFKHFLKAEIMMTSLAWVIPCQMNHFSKMLTGDPFRFCSNSCCMFIYR